MEQVVLRVLRAEVRRRKCPGCGNSLRRADIEASFRNDKNIQLHFRCRFCSFEGGGQFELTPEMCQEAAQIATAEGEEVLLPEPVTVPELDPITGDDLIAVHEILNGWSGDFGQLLAKSSVQAS
ncbi:MAG: hypothetical protein M3Z98_05605 [Candidatus Dormibacteraeota bacterium]|nr:hypothetical protein [Candidatus Dormibacteraeota bacterium]